MHTYGAQPVKRDELECDLRLTGQVVPVINVVLYQPENPHNTGAVVRTCALLNARLHLIKPYGFVGIDGDVRRSSMSYLDAVQVVEHDSWDAFAGSLHGTAARLLAFWDEGSVPHDRTVYHDEDYLLFGQESVGLPGAITSTYPSLRIVMPGASASARSDHRVHSLNLSVSVGIAVAAANSSLRAERD